MNCRTTKFRLDRYVLPVTANLMNLLHDAIYRNQNKILVLARTDTGLNLIQHWKLSAPVQSELRIEIEQQQPSIVAYLFNIEPGFTLFFIETRKMRKGWR